MGTALRQANRRARIPPSSRPYHRTENRCGRLDAQKKAPSARNTTRWGRSSPDPVCPSRAELGCSIQQRTLICQTSLDSSCCTPRRCIYPSPHSLPLGTPGRQGISGRRHSSQPVKSLKFAMQPVEDSRKECATGTSEAWDNGNNSCHTLLAAGWSASSCLLRQVAVQSALMSFAGIGPITITQCRLRPGRKCC